jgi:DNA-binding PadR family transcriptional regulator
MAISSHLRGFEGSTSAFPSIKRIMALLGGSVSRRMVFKALKDLKEAGLIKTERTTERKSNTYHLRIREVIKKAMAFFNEKQRFEGDKKYRGVRKGTQNARKGTYKKTSKRENTSIDYDTIMSQWIVNGEHPQLGVLQKIPDTHLSWLKAYHPHLWEQVRALV